MAYNTNTTGQAAKVAQGTTVTGSFGSPVVVSALGGVTPGGYSSEIMFVVSDGGIFAILAVPQIAAGTDIGQTLVLIGTDDMNSFAFTDGPGVFVGNAALNTFDANFMLTFIWTGKVWANQTNCNMVDTTV